MSTLDDISNTPPSILDEIIDEEIEVAKANEAPPRAFAVIGRETADLAKANRFEGICIIRKKKKMLFDADGNHNPELLIQQGFIKLLAVIDGDNLKRAIRENIPIYGKSPNMFEFEKAVQNDEPTRWDPDEDEEEEEKKPARGSGKSDKKKDKKKDKKER